MDHPRVNHVRSTHPGHFLFRVHPEPRMAKPWKYNRSNDEFCTFLISIIAFMLGYATIIGEIERGSMSALLSLAATRFEIVVGKFLGLGSVLCFTVLVGFGDCRYRHRRQRLQCRLPPVPSIHRDDHGLRPCVLKRGIVFLHGVFQTINCAWRNDFSVVSLHDHPSNCYGWVACDNH